MTCLVMGRCQLLITLPKKSEHSRWRLRSILPLGGSRGSSLSCLTIARFSEWWIRVHAMTGDLGACIAPEAAVRTASTDTVAGWEAVCLRLLLSCGDQYMQIAPECHRRRMAFTAMIAASAASWPLLDGPGRLRSWACSTWRTVSTALATGTPESRVTRVNPALLCSATCA